MKRIITNFWHFQILVSSLRVHLAVIWRSSRTWNWLSNSSTSWVEKSRRPSSEISWSNAFTPTWPSGLTGRTLSTSSSSCWTPSSRASEGKQSNNYGIILVIENYRLWQKICCNKEPTQNACVRIKLGKVAGLTHHILIWSYNFVLGIRTSFRVRVMCVLVPITVQNLIRSSP